MSDNEGKPKMPQRQSRTSLEASRQGDLAAKQLALIDDLGNVAYLCHLSDFLTHYLPPLPEVVNVPDIIEKLARNEKLTSDGFMNAFDQQSSESVNLTESRVFVKLQDLFQDVMDTTMALWPDLKQNYDFKLNSDITTGYDRNIKPGAYWVYNGVNKLVDNEIEWYNICFPTEFMAKDHDNACDDNVRKLLLNMQQIMSLDPRRRFTYGLIVDDIKARFWFCCRGLLLATEGFNFMEDIQTVVHMFVSVAFADEVQLGWDPTIRLNKTETAKCSHRIYDIDFDEKTYTTEAILAEHSVEGLLGRGTRVWKVKEKGSSNESNSFVLKDAWINTNDDTGQKVDDGTVRGRLSEEQIYHEIKKDIENLPDKEQALGLFKRHVIMPRSRVVRVLQDGKEQDDNTFQLLLRGCTAFLDLNKFVILNMNKGLTDPQGQNTGTSAFSLPTDSQRRFGFGASTRPARPKRHERNLYDQIATTLYDETSLFNILKAVGDVVIVLKVIHEAGWIHRDISVNNLYWSRNGLGLLSDLEYAKKKVDTTAHNDNRTGTIQFIASEVARCAYLFYAPPVEDPVPGEELVFNHNDLHDLESLFWVLVWILFYREDCVNPLDKNLRQIREGKMSLFFPSNFVNRQEFLNLRNNPLTVSPSLFPVASVARAIGAVLIQAYTHAERELPGVPQVNIEEFPQAHDALLRQLENAKIHLEIADIQLSKVQLSDVGVLARVPVNKKRTRGSSQDTSSKKPKNASAAAGAS
ncbi:hypothetical protein VKT23_020452 [Stygiomarasmius scandens]|uniref:Protein kinase domain-containing protein n=1 Tax=Marasmiellus scandens TaxID=2682957 RepID=A0ABR1IJ16_9AGAR